MPQSKYFKRNAIRAGWKKKSLHLNLVCIIKSIARQIEKWSFEGIMTVWFRDHPMPSAHITQKIWTELITVWNALLIDKFTFIQFAYCFFNDNDIWIYCMRHFLNLSQVTSSIPWLWYDRNWNRIRENWKRALFDISF